MNSLVSETNAPANGYVAFNVVPETCTHNFGIPIILPSVNSALSQTTQNTTIMLSDINSHNKISLQQQEQHIVSILPNVIAPNYNSLPVLYGVPVTNNVLYYQMIENVNQTENNKDSLVECKSTSAEEISNDIKVKSDCFKSEYKNNLVLMNNNQVDEEKAIKKCLSVTACNNKNISGHSDGIIKPVDPVHKKFSGPLKSILRNSKKNESYQDKSKSTENVSNMLITNDEIIAHNMSDTDSPYISLNTDNGVQNKEIQDSVDKICCISLHTQRKELSNKNDLHGISKRVISLNQSDLNPAAKIISAIKLMIEELSLKNAIKNCQLTEQTFSCEASKSTKSKLHEAIPSDESFHTYAKPITNEYKIITQNKGENCNTKKGETHYKISGLFPKNISELNGILQSSTTIEKSNEKQLPGISKTNIKTEFIESEVHKCLEERENSSDVNSKVIQNGILHQEADTNSISLERQDVQISTFLYSNSSSNKIWYEVEVLKISKEKRNELLLKKKFPVEISNSPNDGNLSMEQANIKVKTEPTEESMPKTVELCKLFSHILQREPLKPLTVTDCEANTEISCADIKPNIAKCEAITKEHELLFQKESESLHTVGKKLCIRDTENVLQNISNETFHELSTSIRHLDFSQSDLLITNTAMCSDGIRRILCNCYADGKCLICGFVSSSSKSSTHKNHLMTHLQTKEFVCGICGAHFRSKPLLNSHKESHNQPNKFDCKDCDKKFKTRGSLLQHAKRHEEKSLVECPICEKNLSNKRNLKKHILIHTGEKPYSCSICQKEFGTRKMLNNHSYVHEPSKQFICEVCNRAFHSRNSLRQHANIHISEKKYKCDICDKEFTFHTNLKQHQVVHSAERLHNCETCGMKFKLPHHLRQHLVIHDPS